MGSFLSAQGFRKYSARYTQQFFCRNPGRYRDHLHPGGRWRSWSDCVLGDKSSSGPHDEASFLKQHSKLDQGIVVIPITIHNYSRGRRRIAIQSGEKIIQISRQAAGIDRQAHNNKILFAKRFPKRAPEFRQGQIRLFERNPCALGDFQDDLLK